MIKLIAKWLEDPSLKNARAVVAYDRKHPLAVYSLTQLGVQVLSACITQVTQGIDFWEM